MSITRAKYDIYKTHDRTVYWDENLFGDSGQSLNKKEFFVLEQLEKSLCILHDQDSNEAQKEEANQIVKELKPLVSEEVFHLMNTIHGDSEKDPLTFLFEFKKRLTVEMDNHPPRFDSSTLSLMMEAADLSIMVTSDGSVIPPKKLHLFQGQEYLSRVFNWDHQLLTDYQMMVTHILDNHFSQGINRSAK